MSKVYEEEFELDLSKNSQSESVESGSSGGPRMVGLNAQSLSSFENQAELDSLMVALIAEKGSEWRV